MSGIIITTTKEQQDELIRIIQGDNEKQAENAWLQLFTLLHPLIFSVASKYISSGLNANNLADLAKKGMKKALNTYDPEKDYKFSTYSTWFMRAEIHRKLGLPVK